MIFYCKDDTIRIGWTSGSKCPYLRFDPSTRKVRVEFPDDEYNFMLPNGWHRYRSSSETREFVIDRKLIESESSASISCSWEIGKWEWHSSIKGCTVHNCSDGTTNGADCETITLGGTAMIDGNSFVSSNATFNDNNANMWWTIFASAAAGGKTEPEALTEKKQPEPKDDWEGKARQRTDDNLRQFFGE